MTARPAREESLPFLFHPGVCGPGLSLLLPRPFATNTISLGLVLIWDESLLYGQYVLYLVSGISGQWVCKKHSVRVNSASCRFWASTNPT